MRHAPAVTVTIGCPRGWRLLHAALAAVAALAALAAALQHLEASAPVTGASLATAAVMAAAFAWRLPAVRRGLLRWDGQAWWFAPEGDEAAHPGRLHLMIDLGSALLLRFDPDPPGSGSAWLPVPALPAAEAVSLRAAVYSRRLKPDHPARRARDPE